MIRAACLFLAALFLGGCGAGAVIGTLANIAQGLDRPSGRKCQCQPKMAHLCQLKMAQFRKGRRYGCDALPLVSLRRLGFDGASVASGVGPQTRFRSTRHGSPPGGVDRMRSA